MQPVVEMARRVRDGVERVVVGKREVVELAIAAALADGHILIEDVPGLAKTLLAKSLARSLGCSFRRIQCTPDLLPSDITGLYYFNQRSQAFEFRPGPVFAQVVLADEVNRATPRTQSALLEAMEERQVTIEGETHPLPRPFLVIATQNPIELQGTFPLPEAQLDRFLVRLSIGYPSADEERAILGRFRADNPYEDLQPVTSPEEVQAAQRAVRQTRVSAAVEGYVAEIVRATRGHEAVVLGASPRGSLALMRVAQALAAMAGRAFVTPDDVKRAAPAVLPHRLILNAQARLREQGADEVVADVLATVPVPVETGAGAHRGQAGEGG
ncbi:MAG: MoxR family ATPase [Armatimonadota bacterium]|nr:MoxR family ATPase [Armatimonadota bacterium]MDR5696631.1 MoxR family ATPase [Armatimonadota bacterium]